jgi:hypothetical protein
MFFEWCVADQPLEDNMVMLLLTGLDTRRQCQGCVVPVSTAVLHLVIQTAVLHLVILTLLCCTESPRGPG